MGRARAGIVAPHCGYHPSGRVSFYTYTGLGAERIVRHFVSYDRNSYVFETREDEVALGRGGFAF